MSQRKEPLDSLTPRPTAEALATARQALARCQGPGLPSPEAAPYLSGGVQLEWRGVAENVRLLIHPDGSAEYLVHGQSRRPAETARGLLEAVFSGGR